MAESKEGKDVDPQLIDAFVSDMQQIVDRYNLGVVLVGLSCNKVPCGEITGNPADHATVERLVLLNNSALQHAKSKLQHEDLQAALKSIDHEFTQEELLKEYVTLIGYLRVVTYVANKVTAVPAVVLQELTTRIARKLGLDRARLIPLKLNTPYLVFTDDGHQYNVIYNDDFVFTVTSSTTDPPTRVKAMFMGNVQDDGVIFSASEMPVVSTGDRLLFGKKGTGFEPPSPELITGRLIDAVEANDIQ